MADDRFDDARPSILLEGQDDPDLRQGMLSLLIAETSDGLFRCELGLGNQGSGGQGVDFLYFDRKKLDFGKRLRVELKGEPLFEGRITALEARFPSASPPELVLLAEDALQDLRMVRRTRSFVDQSDTAVFNAIADEHGMEKAVVLPGGSYKLLAQVNQSDLAFLRERARAIEAELWVSMTNGKPTLNAKPRSARQSAPVKLAYRNELSEFCVIADLAGQRSSVLASGWDVAAKAALRYEAKDSDLGSELGATDSGASLLRAKLGERKESLAHGVPWTQDEAEARAQAYFKQQARRFVVGHGVAATSGKLRVGTQVDLDGLGPLFNGKYYLAAVRHRFDGARGLRTEFSAERAGLGRP